MKENTEQLHQELQERIKNRSLLSLAHRFGPSAPLVNLDDLSTYLECLAKLFLTVFHLFLVFQTKVSSTLELADLEISGFQEDLFGFIIDQVVSTKGVHHLLSLRCQCFENYIFAAAGFGLYVAMVKNYVCRCCFICMDICVSVVMYVWIQYIVSLYICCWRSVSHECLYCCYYNVS